MNYVKTYESFVGDVLNEVTDESIKTLSERITKLQQTGERLKKKDWAGIIERKKKSVDNAKIKKDDLRLAVAQREYDVTVLRKGKNDLRLDMMTKEIEFLQAKLTYQQESLKIKQQIEKLKPKQDTKAK
jgi:hypothetical protein